MTAKKGENCVNHCVQHAFCAKIATPTRRGICAPGVRASYPLEYFQFKIEGIRLVICSKGAKRCAIGEENHSRGGKLHKCEILSLAAYERREQYSLIGNKSSPQSGTLEQNGERAAIDTEPEGSAPRVG